MRQVENGSWVNDQQKVRHTLREVPWCLEDGSRARLPVLKGAAADEVYLELVGAPPLAPVLVSAKLAEHALACPLSRGSVLRGAPVPAPSYRGSRPGGAGCGANLTTMLATALTVPAQRQRRTPRLRHADQMAVLKGFGSRAGCKHQAWAAGRCPYRG